MEIGGRYFIAGVAALGTAVMCATVPVQADESPFASIYTTETLPEGETEVEQWATWTSSKPDERFDEVVGRTAFEYGVTSRFQLALYANYARTKIVPYGPGAPDGPADTTRFNGFSAEAIYHLLDPTPMPSALPSISSRPLERESALRRRSCYSRRTSWTIAWSSQPT
jgi:hypothetical protein